MPHPGWRPRYGTSLVTVLVAVVATVLAAVLVAVGTVYAMSERALRDVELPPPFTVAIPTDSSSVAHGAHVARTRGCLGCHGQQLEGAVFDEWEWVELAVAPNLAQLARTASPAQLEAAIRHGVGRDGRALWSMPSYNFKHLSDGDVASLIGFLQTAPVVEQALPYPRPTLGLQARWALVRGDEEHMVDWVADVPPRILGPDADSVLRRGEYLAMTTCNECHGSDLRGAWEGPEPGQPDLAIIAGYSWEEFTTLMQTGTSRTGRSDLGLMTVVARDRFAAFTDQERDALYRFLQSLLERPVPQPVPWRPARGGDDASQP